MGEWRGLYASETDLRIADRSCDISGDQCASRSRGNSLKFQLGRVFLGRHAHRTRANHSQGWRLFSRAILERRFEARRLAGSSTAEARRQSSPDIEVSKTGGIRF